MSNLHNAEILITGGTGSLGLTLVKTLVKYHSEIKGIRVFSRDELKQWLMKQEINVWCIKNKLYVPISYLVGDVRDIKRLKIAMRGVTHVIHAAAMKQVPACEENPLEAIKTNIGGAENILEAALSCDSIEKVLGISTDKAIYPINLYGVTKAAMEKLFIQGNVYSKGHERKPRFSCCRYGNVIGSRGSVIPLFKSQYDRNQEITVTDLKMTRFWITRPAAARFVINRLMYMEGGEIFVPKMPSCRVVDLARMLIPDVPIKYVGIRKGEKIHEWLITTEESSDLLELGKSYVISSRYQNKHKKFAYNSLSNERILKKDEFHKMLIEEV